MKVMLKLVLNCTPDAAWQAVRSPSVFTAVSKPFTTFSSLEPDGFPAVWPAGDHPAAAKAFGLVPIGVQVIRISFPDPVGDVRRVLDTGFGESGLLTGVRRWNHTMAVSPAPGGKTLYRDRLIFEAGAITPLLWPVYWAFWQWRALRISQLARGWDSALNS
ncbi:hypothetical protein BH09ACT1_BH09ACT1_29500 [soil metagenome]